MLTARCQTRNNQSPASKTSAWFALCLFLPCVKALQSDRFRMLSNTRRRMEEHAMVITVNAAPVDSSRQMAPASGQSTPPSSGGQQERRRAMLLALKKKLALEVSSEKVDGRGRVYRLCAH